MKTQSVRKNAILNAIRQLCSILFPMITFPYAVRILGVNNYGLVNYTASIVTYFSLLAALGIQNYCVREGSRIREDKSELSKFANQLFTINLITSAISFILLLVLATGWKELNQYLTLIIVQSMVIPLSLIGCEWVNIVFEDYTYITIRYIIIQIISITLLFCLVKSEKDFVYYAAIMTFAQAGGGLLNVYYIKRNYLNIRITTHDLEIHKHIKPLLILFIVTISSYIYINADTTMLGLMKNNAEVGYYSSATKIYTLAKMMINAIIIPTIPRINAYLGKKDFKGYNQIIGKTISIIGLLVLPSATGLFCLSESILEVICGSSYVAASMALKILSIALIIAPFSYFFSSGILVSNKKETVFLAATIAGSVLNILLNIMIIPKYGYNGAAFTTLVSELCVFVITFCSARKLYNAVENHSWIIDSIVGCVLIVGVCTFSKKLTNNAIVLIVICIIISVIIYLIVLFVRKNTLLAEIITQIQQKLGKKQEG